MKYVDFHMRFSILGENPYILLSERRSVEEFLCPKSIGMLSIGALNQKRVCEKSGPEMDEGSIYGGLQLQLSTPSCTRRMNNSDRKRALNDDGVHGMVQVGKVTREQQQELRL